MPRLCDKFIHPPLLLVCNSLSRLASTDHPTSTSLLLSNPHRRIPPPPPSRRPRVRGRIPAALDAPRENTALTLDLDRRFLSSRPCTVGISLALFTSHPHRTTRSPFYTHPIYIPLSRSRLFFSFLSEHGCGRESVAVKERRYIKHKIRQRHRHGRRRRQQDAQRKGAAQAPGEAQGASQAGELEGDWDWGRGNSVASARPWNQSSRRSSKSRSGC